MTTIALNSLLTYLQSLSLAQSDREWLAKKLIEPTTASSEATASIVSSTVHPKLRPLSPEVEQLGNLKIKPFTQQELSYDPILAAIVNDRRTV